MHHLCLFVIEGFDEIERYRCIRRFFIQKLQTAAAMTARETIESMIAAVESTPSSEVLTTVLSPPLGMLVTVLPFIWEGVPFEFPGA